MSKNIFISKLGQIFLFILKIHFVRKTFCFFIDNKWLFLIVLHMVYFNVYVEALKTCYLQGDQVREKNTRKTNAGMKLKE